MLIKIKRLFLRLMGKYPPVIPTEWGPVTEGARYQGAMNMKEDPELRKKVEELLIARAGGRVDEGLRRAREWYPEAYD